MILFGKNKCNKQINELTNKYNELKNSTLDRQMEKLKLISLHNEEYKELYVAIEANYSVLINDYYLDIEESISTLENSKNVMDIKLVKQEIKNISEKIEKADNEKKVIINQISKMFEEENKIREELIPLKETYRNFLNDYKASYKELDEFVVLFDKACEKLEKDINDIEDLLTSGKYKLAKEIFLSFKVTLKEYTTHINVMPEMINFTFKILPSRYKAILQTYDEMKNQGYVLFSIKMSVIQDEIETLFKNIKTAFYELKYIEVKEDIRTLTFKINDVSVKLNEERESKDNFDSENDKVYAYIDDISKKFLKAKRDFYSVNGVYLIDKSKEDELIFIENEIHALSRIKMELETYIHSPTKYPYSTLNSKLMELSVFSDSINSKVDSFQNYIYSLKEDSQAAYKYVNDTSVTLTYYYNLIISLNHKVLSTEYKDRYKMITDTIDVISKELITKPIYVEKINAELQVFKDTVSSFLSEIKSVIKLHNSASDIIIYTNKYRSSFSVVNDVLNRAQIHFENGEFEFAIDSVSEILQQVHPQAYAEMVRYKEDGNE